VVVLRLRRRREFEHPSIPTIGAVLGVVAVDEYERLHKLQQLKAPSFAELLLAMPTDGEEFDRLEGRMREPRF